MAKKKKTEVAELDIVITPVSVEAITVNTQQEIEVPQGYVLLVALNADGTDRPASEFFYPEKKLPEILRRHHQIQIENKI